MTKPPGPKRPVLVFLVFRILVILWLLDIRHSALFFPLRCAVLGVPKYEL